jgi:outer membrane receptor protein involved in Fe transport
MGVVPGNLGNVPAAQVIYDRYGNIKTPADVYNLWDPGAEIQPEAGMKIYPYERNNLDGYSNQDNAWYVNYQLSALQDRLNVLAGYRQETYRQSGQRGTTNFPWYAPGPYAWAEPDKYPPAAYNYSISYASSNFLTQTGDSWMAGLSYEIMKDVNVYATVSKTFHYNGNSQLGAYTAYITTFNGNDPNTQLTDLFTQTLAAYASIGEPLVYKFPDGSSRTLTSVADCFKAIQDAGADRRAQNEQGYNREIGVKTSLWDGKFTSTFSLFQADRQNQRKEDGFHQSIDVFNFNYNPIIAPDGTDYTPLGSHARHFRWYSNDAHDRTQGVDFEVIWTPMRNFQSFITGSYIWTAKTVSDPTVQPTNIYYDLYFNTRLEYTPEYTFKTFNKYTFTDGPIRGASVGLGIRHASKTSIGRNNSWNPKEGGLAGADYTVFDLTLAYPYEIYGYKLKSQLGIYNLTDEVYTEGSYTLAPARYWTLSTTLTF